MYKISVIVPIYNTEMYLNRCIDSIINQTYDNLEIILVNDGSNDSSGHIIDEYAKKDSRVIPIHKKNGGVSSARNVGMKVATGEYIGFVDSDDWIEADMYEKMANEIKYESLDMVICGFFKDNGMNVSEVRNNKSISSKVFGGEEMLKYVFYREDYRAFAAYSWNKIVKKKLLGLSKYCEFNENISIGEDVLWLVNISQHIKKVKYINNTLYHYVQNEDSVMHSADARKKVDLIKVYLNVIDILEKQDIPKDVLIFVKRFLVYHSMNVAKSAMIEDDMQCMRCAQDVMKKYKQEYLQTNLNNDKRIKEFEFLINL
ncbi:MAG: glycosyltransferase [Lachnospiraceae bacterium]|nr:glycosyltransferase [Lachnospiraceae bacterium]